MEVYVITGLMCSLIHYLKVYYLIKKVHDYPIKFSDTNFDASHCLLCLFIYILNSTKPIQTVFSSHESTLRKIEVWWKQAAMSPRSQVSESPTDEVRVKTASRLSLSKAAKLYVVVVQRFFRGLLFGPDIRSEAAEVRREHLFRCFIEFLHWLPGNFDI